MSIFNINNCNYHYDIHGSGEEILVFSHGILWSNLVFKKQIEYFSPKYTVLVYDQCGHGKSETTGKNHSSSCLYKDIIQLLNYLNFKQVHFIGLSMGADIAIRITLKQPDLIKSLILMSASITPETNFLKYQLLNNIVKFSGIKTVLQPILVNMFSLHFLNEPHHKEEVKKWTTEILKNEKDIHIVVSSALKRKNIDKKELENISCPTLILTGTEDKATPPENSEFIHLKIKGSVLHYIEGSGHMINIEDPDKCNSEIENFLSQFSK